MQSLRLAFVLLAAAVAVLVASTAMVQADEGREYVCLVVAAGLCEEGEGGMETTDGLAVLIVCVCVRAIQPHPRAHAQH